MDTNRNVLMLSFRRYACLAVCLSVSYLLNSLMVYLFACVSMNISLPIAACKSPLALCVSQRQAFSSGRIRFLVDRTICISLPSKPT